MLPTRDTRAHPHQRPRLRDRAEKRASSTLFPPCSLAPIFARFPSQLFRSATASAPELRAWLMVARQPLYFGFSAPSRTTSTLGGWLARRLLRERCFAGTPLSPHPVIASGCTMQTMAVKAGRVSVAARRFSRTTRRSSRRSFFLPSAPTRHHSKPIRVAPRFSRTAWHV